MTAVPDDHLHDDHLHDLPDAMHTTPRMAAIFSGQARVRRMLEFESALAAAEAQVGLVPAAAAEDIVRACATAAFDVADLARRGAVAGTIAVPVVAALRQLVGPEAGRYVHLGATSQDVIDTALVLQMRDGLDAVIEDLARVGDACAALAHDHRDTPMAGRTLLQQAVPVTFGLKAAGWLAAVTRLLLRLGHVRAHHLDVQFGGAAGTLAPLGVDGIRVTERLAATLGLGVPPLPWHTERTRIADVASALATTTGAMAKTATDVVLLMQTEVGEAAEASGPGKGQSSAMPQKRNPVDTMAVIASGRLASAHAGTMLAAMSHEHERSVGDWQAEWTAVPSLFRLAGSSVARIGATLAGLTVDPARMRRNLDSSGGLLLAESLATALAASLGKPAAHDLVAELSARVLDGRGSLAEAAHASERVRGVLSSAEIDAALDPVGYLGSAGLFVDRALEAFAAVRPESPAVEPRPG